MFTGLNTFARKTYTGGTIHSWTKLHGWIYTSLQELTIGNRRTGTRQKLFEHGEFIPKMLQLDANQILGTARHFVEYWEPQKILI